MQAISDGVICIMFYHHCLYLGNLTHSSIMVHSVQLVYTDRNKEIDLPVLLHVPLHRQSFACLPVHSVLAYVKVGRLKVK